MHISELEHYCSCWLVCSQERRSVKHLDWLVALGELLVVGQGTILGADNGADGGRELYPRTWIVDF